MNNLQIYHDEWKLINFINLENLLNKPNQIKIYLSRISKECSRLSEGCTDFVINRVDFMYKRLSMIMKYQLQLNNFIGHSQNKDPDSKLSKLIRGKRGALNIIGDFQKALFGVLTESDAIYYNQQIDQVFNDTRKLATLMENQTKYIQSSLGILSTNIDKMAIEMSRTNGRVDYVLNATHKLQQYELSVAYSNHLVIIEEYLFEYELEINILIDAILFARLGAIHPRILSSETLMNSLRQIQGSEGHIRFPIPLNNAYAEELIRISQLSITYVDKKIIYILSIPLLDNKVFNLYKLIPVPVKQDYNKDQNIFAFIVPATRYFAISNDHLTYQLISTNQFDKCLLSLGTYLCKQDQPFFIVTNNQGCELNLFLNPITTNLHNCDVRIKQKIESYWNRINEENAWIYSVLKNESITILCPNTIYKSLSGSGILTMKQKCIGQNQNVIFVSDFCGTV